MIDYLERLFAPEAAAQETEEQTARPRLLPEMEDGAGVTGLVVESEEPLEMSRPGPEEQEPVFADAPRIQSEAFRQEEAVRRLDHALTVEEGGRESIPIRRPSGEREGEALERRLRRDSRRYDSGFFWY